VQGGVEVVAVFGEGEVGAEQQAAFEGSDRLAEVFQRQVHIAEHEQHDAQGQQRRNDPSGPRRVETWQGKALLLQAVEDEAGHQKTGNDEKYVNPGKSAAETRDLEMKQHHREHGERA